MKTPHPAQLTRLIERYPLLAVCAESISATHACLSKSLSAGGTLFLCGNGGSAADAEHWAGELLKGFLSKRPLSPQARRGLPRFLAENLQWGFPVIPLTGFPSFSTAFANDVAPALIFAQLVHVLGRPGDVLVGISTSGNAQNVIHAAQTARAREMTTIAMTGESGGTLKEVSDICIAAPARSTPDIQEYHLPIYHCISLMLEEEFADQPISRHASSRHIDAH